MGKKIFAIVWLILSIMLLLYTLLSPDEMGTSYLFVIVYYLGVTFINIKYLEGLK